MNELKYEELLNVEGGTIMPYIESFVVNRIIWTNAINSYNIQQQCNGDVA